MLTRRSFIGAIVATPLIMRSAMAASPDIFAEGGLAIRGADPVAFFETGAPVIGKESHQLMWRGATWRFDSAANMSKFEANPEAVAPQYGGYCAFAMSKGYIATSVPEAWTIHDGKLYLNYSLSVRTIWQRDIPGNIDRANTHWPDILTM